MRKILKIAKLELSILFYSPIAWLVLTIFMIQCGMGFLDNLQSIQTSLGLGYQSRPITGVLFGGSAGLFTIIQSNLYLYLPILTMGLMSRETSSGSIKLLLSSPVKLREIILGKYLAIIGYGFLLILVLAIFGISGMLTIVDADFGRILAGLFGLYLLICTYAAIGLFMSCLTTYQVVAAISTLAIFAVLRFVGALGQNIDFVRDLTYFLSISGRTDKMIAGLVTTKDVFYYMIIITTFLTLCVLRLKSERELKPWTVKAGRYVVLIFTALFLGYISSRPIMIGYFDATAANSLTITKTSQDIAKKVKGDLKVTTYANMLAPNIWAVLPASRNADLSRLESYKRFIPGMDVSYTYFYQKPTDSTFADYRYNPNLKGITNTDAIADQMAINMDIDRKLFISPKAIDKLVDLKPEGYLTVRKLAYEGKSTFLRFYMGPGEQDPYAAEAEFMAAVKRLLVDAPKVVFISGNNERAISDNTDRGYAMIAAKKTRRFALINQGFDVDTININSTEIPANAAIVVLADPTQILSLSAQQRLAAWIAKGGNLLVTGDPERREVLNPILKTVGLQMRKGVLLTTNQNFTPNFIYGLMDKKAASLDSNLNKLSKYGLGVGMLGASALDYNPQAGFNATPLLVSPNGGWNRILPIDPTLPTVRYNAAEGDEQSAFPMATALSRKVNNKEQRIFVAGDADFISNAELSRSKRGENEYFIQGVFRWLSNNLFPVDVSRPEPKDMSLTVNRDHITIMKYLLQGVVPALIAIMGAILLFKRRRN
jgi:ABC-2 type transport system permease protein